jgi:glycine cleavage system H protein
MTDSSTPTDRRYTSEHEWIRRETDDSYVVGITVFAQEQLGDIVYIELPSPGDKLKAGATFGVIESVKTASDLFAPVAGEVLAVNTALTEEPQTVNDDPYEAGWMIKLRPDDASTVDALLDAAQYDDQIGQ